MRYASWIIVLSVFLTGSYAMAIEEPAYTVVKTAADYELRRYDAYLVAEVDVQGEFDDAGGEAFNILAGYIFGKNKAQEKMRMTAPVESSGVRMAMTAPVISYEQPGKTSGQRDRAARRQERGRRAGVHVCFCHGKQVHDGNPANAQRCADTHRNPTATAGCSTPFQWPLD